MKKVILITGASSGMGHYTAKELIKDGHMVYCAARSVDKMKDLEQLGGHIIKMDVSNEKSIAKGVVQIIKEQKKIDVLWNNAGYGLFGPVEDIPLDDVREQFEVNVFGLGLLTQLVLPHMRKKKSGLIINTSSMGGKMYSPLGAWYHATKHAVEGFSDCLRLEVVDFGIKVVVLEPGLIKTDFGKALSQHFPAKSATGPYRRIVHNLRNTSMFSKGSSSKVISDTIKIIIAVKNPKPRYLVGKYAKLAVYTRHIFGDRTFDKLIRRQLK
jgi:short-subunit dehydrogenase